MASLFIILLAFVILFGSQLSHAQSIYERIEDRLGKIRNKADVFGEVADLRSDLSRHELRVLEKFLQLEKLSRNSTCNREGYEILRNNTDLWENQEQPRMKAMRLMNSQAIKHAKLCESFYVNRFYAQDNNYDKAFEEVSDFFSSIKKNKLGLFSSDSVSSFKIKDIGSEEEIRQAYDILVKLAEADDHPYMRYLYADVDLESGAIKDNPSKIDKLFRQYFIDPCDDLIAKFGPDVFIPAIYNVANVKKDIRYGSSLTRAVSADKFYKVMRDYRFCLALKRNKWAFVKGITKISSDTLA